MKNCGSCKFAGYRYCEKLDTEVVSKTNGFYVNESLIDCCEYWESKYPETEEPYFADVKVGDEVYSLRYGDSTSSRRDGAHG
jgi:hypothetical protein